MEGFNNIQSIASNRSRVRGVHRKSCDVVCTVVGPGEGRPLKEVLASVDLERRQRLHREFVAKYDKKIQRLRERNAAARDWRAAAGRERDERTRNRLRDLRELERHERVKLTIRDQDKGIGSRRLRDETRDERDRTKRAKDAERYRKMAERQNKTLSANRRLLDQCIDGSGDRKGGSRSLSDRGLRDEESCSVKQSGEWLLLDEEECTALRLDDDNQSVRKFLRWKNVELLSRTV